MAFGKNIVKAITAGMMVIATTMQGQYLAPPARPNPQPRPAAPSYVDVPSYKRDMAHVLQDMRVLQEDIRALLEQLAATKWQVVGGARCVVKDGKLESVEIEGQPLDDNRVYGVATISFLLNGGDGLFVARNAKKLDIYPEYLIDIMLPYVQELTAQGKPVEYSKDGRIQIIETKNESAE